MNFLRFIGVHARDEDAATRPMYVAPPPRQRAVIAGDQALTLDSVYRAVQILQVAASQLTLDAWRDDEPLLGSAYPQVLVRPWEDADQTDLITEAVASLALRGNAYIRVVRDPAGQVISLRPLHPLECVPTLHTGSMARTVQWRGKTYGPADILHLRLLRVPGQAEGLGPIQACIAQIGGALEMSDYASKWMGSGGVPTGILSTDQHLTKAQAEEAKEIWTANNSAANGIGVIGAGLKFQALALKPSEVQFLESREFDAKAVARMFGIPPHLSTVNASGSSLTYQNIQDADMSFIRWTGMAYLRPIEAGISRILNGRKTVRFNLDAFLRPDTRTRYETYKTGIDAGFITPEWVQETEGIHPQQKGTPA